MWGCKTLACSHARVSYQETAFIIRVSFFKLNSTRFFTWGKKCERFYSSIVRFGKNVYWLQMWDGGGGGILQQGEANHTSHFDIDIYPEMSKKQIRYLQLQQTLTGLFLNSFEKSLWWKKLALGWKPEGKLFTTSSFLRVLRKIREKWLLFFKFFKQKPVASINDS